jgi:hypothetical protein
LIVEASGTAVIAVKLRFWAPVITRVPRVVLKEPVAENGTLAVTEIGVARLYPTAPELWSVIPDVPVVSVNPTIPTVVETPVMRGVVKDPDNTPILNEFEITLLRNWVPVGCVIFAVSPVNTNVKETAVREVLPKLPNTCPLSV